LSRRYDSVSFTGTKALTVYFQEVTMSETDKSRVGGSQCENLDGELMAATAVLRTLMANMLEQPNHITLLTWYPDIENGSGPSLHLETPTKYIWLRNRFVHT
jgi:hypothetical protein